MIARVLAAAAVLGAAVTADPARAANVLTNPPNFFDFGDVPIGVDVSKDFAVTLIGGDGETFVSFFPGLPAPAPGLVLTGQHDCAGFGVCTLTIRLSLMFTGPFADTFLMALIYRDAEDHPQRFTPPMRIEANGVALPTVAAPLPGAFALFGGGLGALALAGWRRRTRRAR